MKEKPTPTVCLDGKFVPAAEARISIFDRGFLYGDSVFETLRIYHGQPFRWQSHIERLASAAEFLRFEVPVKAAELRHQVDELMRRNAADQAVLRITWSRGIGRRGYGSRGARLPCQALTLHPLPAQASRRAPWRLITSSQRLGAGDPLVNYKTGNRLPYILARDEADRAGADEAVLLNARGFVAEASSANLFWVDDGGLVTPPLKVGILPGVTRSVVLELCGALGLPCRQCAVRREQLVVAKTMFLTSSVFEIREATVLDGLRFESHPVIQRLQAGYRRLVQTECRRENRVPGEF